MKNPIVKKPVVFSLILAVFSVTGLALAAEGNSAPSAQKLFESKCSQCHGKDAKGSPKMIKVLQVDPKAVDLTGPKASKMTADEMEKTITQGRQKMPKFKRSLTPGQIKEVIAYIRTLQGGMETPAKDGKK